MNSAARRAAVSHRLAQRPLAPLLLGALTVAVLWPVTGNGFIDLDDARYLGGNPAREHWAGAFTGMHGGNWNPMTWTAHRLLTDSIGLDPFSHHLASLLLHASSAALACVVVRALSGLAAPALLVAALFAWHPLHVESVAWAAQLKDILAGLFSTLAIGAYLFWLRRPGVARYLAVTAAIALALMSKATAVPLPLLLLIMDWWPLGRFRSLPPRRLFVEKVPWLALALGSAALAVIAQSRAGAVGSLEAFPLAQRLAGAAAGFGSYLSRTLWPAGLSFFYPHPPGGFSPGRTAAGALLLVLLAGAAFALRRRSPWLAAGLAWFMVALLPASGLVQVSVHAMADRYTYLPLTGVFLAVAFSLPRRGARWFPAAVAAGVCLCLSLLALAARQRTGEWRDTATLARSALAADQGNWMAHAILGRADLEARRPAEGLRHLAEALRLEQRDSRVWFDYGLGLLQTGDSPGAARAFDRAAALDPGNAEVRAFRDHLRGSMAAPVLP